MHGGGESVCEGEGVSVGCIVGGGGVYEGVGVSLGVLWDCQESSYSIQATLATHHHPGHP